MQPGWVGNDAFLAGYGAAQAVPGPLFTFAAYLGTVMAPPPNGWLGRLISLLAIFLPSFLLAIGPLPFWSWIRQHPVIVALLLLVSRKTPPWLVVVFGAAAAGLVGLVAAV